MSSFRLKAAASRARWLRASSAFLLATAIGCVSHSQKERAGCCVAAGRQFEVRTSSHKLRALDEVFYSPSQGRCICETWEITARGDFEHIRWNCLTREELAHLTTIDGGGLPATYMGDQARWQADVESWHRTKAALKRR